MQYPGGVYSHLESKAKLPESSSIIHAEVISRAPEAGIKPVSETTTRSVPAAGRNTVRASIPTPRLSQQPAKKRKSPVPSRREWEELNFDVCALSIIQEVCEKQGRVFPQPLQEQLSNLTKQVAAQKRRTKGKFILLGLETVKFFMQHQDLIPVMRVEMNRRRVLRAKGEDLLDVEINNARLCRHCCDNATFIYTKNKHDTGDYSFNRNYLRVRSDYTETMGRACTSAEWALSRYRDLKREMENQVQIVLDPKEQPAPPMPNRPVQEYLKGFEQPVQPDLASAIPQVASEPVPQQDLLPGFVMPASDRPDSHDMMYQRKKRKSTRKLRLPDTRQYS